jgi:hypothetical protein
MSSTGPGDPFKPYAPPKAAVLEAASEESGEYIPGGQKLAGGRGSSWFGEAWELFKQSPGIWILIFVIWVLISFAFAIIPGGQIASSVLYPVFTAGLMLGCRELEQGGELKVEHLFAGFKKNTGNLALVGLLYLVGVIAIVVVAGILGAITIPLMIGAGSAGGDFASMMVLVPMFLLIFLVVLALMVPLFMALWFAPALVIFHDVQPMDSLKSSFHGCLKNLVPFLIYGLLGLLLAILAAIPLFLGYLVLGPMIWASMYAGYKDIFVRQK